MFVEASPVHSDEEAQRLPENYDPLLLTDETLPLATLVEEELLLSMPIITRHKLAECSGE